MGYRILGDPFRKKGARLLGQSGHDGFRFNQLLDFEAGLITGLPNAFDSVSGAGAATLTAALAAAIRGNFGCSVGIPGDSAARFGRVTGLDSEKKLTSQFFLDPNSIVMALANQFTAVAIQSPGAGSAVIELFLGFNASGFFVQYRARNDAGGAIFSTVITITDEPHLIRMDFLTAENPGDDDGFVNMYIDGVMVDSDTGIDNDTHNGTAILMGAVAGVDAGTNGTIFFDNLEWANSLM